MRSAAVLAAVSASVLAVAGCGGQPSFDERYEEKAAMIRNQAQAMERDAARQIAAANAAERAMNAGDAASAAGHAGGTR